MQRNCTATAQDCDAISQKCCFFARIFDSSSSSDGAAKPDALSRTRIRQNRSARLSLFSDRVSRYETTWGISDSAGNVDPHPTVSSDILRRWITMSRRSTLGATLRKGRLGTSKECSTEGQQRKNGTEGRRDHKGFWQLIGCRGKGNRVIY
jgi:hypothetical protein